MKKDSSSLEIPKNKVRFETENLRFNYTEYLWKVFLQKLENSNKSSDI